MLRKLVPLLAALLLGAAVAQSLDLFHDKANWQPAFEAVMELAPDAVGAEVTAVPYADTSSYQAAVRSALRTSQAPGLFTWWSGYRMKDLVDAGMVADVTDIWQEYIDAGLYSPSLASAFTFDDRIYAVPNFVAYWVVFYNKAVFEEYGLTPPETWEELEQIAATLAENGVTPFGQTVEGRWPSFIWFQEFLVRQNPDFYRRLMEGEASYTDPEVAQALETWKEWIDAGYFTDPSISFGTAGTNAMASEFAKGNVAMILVGNWYADTILEAGLAPDQFGAFIMPNMDPELPPAVIFEAGPLLVSNNSAAKEQALAVADFWMSAPAQQVWVDEQNFIPVNAEVEATAPLVAGLANEVNEGGYTLINRYWEATPAEIAEAAVDELGAFMLDPETAQAVMENLEAIAQRYWSQNQ